MADFPAIPPIVSAVKSSRPITSTVKFNSGYEQRTKFGLNQNPKEWSLTFMVNTADANTIESFLDARADDSASFEWTPPDSTTKYRWVCNQWNSELLGDTFFKITVTFRQVFEP